MGDDEWMSRLRRFASTGVWPSEAGNRPGPRQKKWFDLFQGIDKCPMQVRRQATLFGGPQECLCGFHPPKTLICFIIIIIMFVDNVQYVSLQPGSHSPPPSARPSLSPSSSPSPSTIQPATSASPVARPPSAARPPSTIPSPAVRPPSVARPPSTSPSPAARPPSTSPSPAARPPSAASPTEEHVAPSMPGPAPASEPDQFWLPTKMRQTVPSQDQRWIASALFHSGRLQTDLKLWYEPPVPSLIYHQAPSPDRFFNHRLLVWMPYHLWKFRLFCPACGKQLTGYGLHKRARKVLDIDRYYLMVTETLRCTVCCLSYLSTSQTVLDQLDVPHRRLFRLILTQKYACDIRVIRMLRERTLGNSPTRLVKQLRENHGEEWLDRLAHYMEECAGFINRPSLLPVMCQKPPEPIDVPTSKWLLSVYGRDIISRINHNKASITSTFGTILKMDSTKQITKKLAGTAKGTAQWVTSVGNETGQILISVLTAQEGPALDTMVSGLINRYSQAAVAPPLLLYVDCGCCIEKGQSKLQARFGGWPDLNIRLDIWHFMRRLAVGCTTDAHPLYPVFMSRLSACIFEWDPDDVALLRRAKREQLQEEGVPVITDNLVDQRNTKKELALYCRRRTRGVESTTRYLDRLLQELMGDKGRDMMGVPLLDTVRIEHIWRVQMRHVKCIQDPPGVLLYTVTGTTTTKGGLVLTKYRCARGSTSLESFHLHLNRFIPGTSANTLNFQLYLLEGLNRWNQDRAAASISTKSSPLLTYAGQVVQSINTNSLNVFGEKLVPTFQPPAQYTGELIGVDYLLSQTGQPLQSMDTDNEQTDQLLEEVNVDEQDEGFEEDINEDPTVSFLLEDEANCNPPTVQTVHPSSQSAAASSQTAAPSSQSAAPSSQSAAPSSQSAAASSQSAAASSLSTAPSSQSAAPSSQSAAPSSLFAAASSQFAFSQSAAPSSQSAFSQPAAVASSSRSTTSIVQYAPGSPTQVPEELLAVDDQNIPGMDRVDRLAEYLVELRTSTGLTLSRQQVDDIVCLWQSLLEYDKQRVKFAARHQDRLTTGRFRSPKKKAVFTPGVDSLKRSVLASTASPAQWPDCCRLVEAIFIRLCRIHPSPRKKEKVTLSRWSLVLHDYRKIRQLILSNGAIMQDTTLQLVEVNQTTLVQWHNGRVKKQDQTLLLQGIDLPDPLGVAAQALPPARVLAVAPPQVQGEQHIYKLPQSTAGQAKLKRRITGNTTEAVIPKLATLRPIIPLPVGNLQPQLPEPVLPSPSPTVPLASHTTPTLTLFVVPQSPLPIAPATPSFVLPPPATVSQSQPTVPRPYHRKVEANTCRKYMSKPKSHKGLGDEEWMSRLRRFANTGVWPSEAGNRPAPRQKKWYELFQRIDKCPRQVRGQASLFGGPQSCLCGFHPPKNSFIYKIIVYILFNLNVLFDWVYYVNMHYVSLQTSSASSVPSSHSDSPAAITTVTTSTSPSTSVRTSPSLSPMRTSPSPSSVRASASPSPSLISTPSASGYPVASGSHTFMAVPAPSSSPADSSIPALPAEMRKTIPSQDQRWIVSTLFQAGRLRPDLKLWYEPPVPSLIYHQAPTPDRFFTHRLLVWMPYHQWKVRLLCPVCGKQLTGYGIHKRARKVLDIDRYYLMVTETLRCTICRTNYLSTSQTVLDQLDLPHRRLFRLILTYKYACDIRVIRLLRERTLGNSPARLAKQLKENHGEEWLDRLAHYMGECAAFVDCPSSLPVVFQEPPEPFEVPTSKWLLTVYGKDIVSRLDHIKAGITSTFGTILKMDSTKKITKKLAGTAKGTAQWLSSVGNETGQILISVLTAQDGPGLDSMISGLISRYQQAGVDPPVLLYVDTGCCIEEGQSKLQTRFGGWPTLNIRLDIWHFMRRLATGCTTDAHPLYPTFMARLSECIFEWDPHDIALLRQAKREQLEDEGLLFISGNLLNRRITKKELSLYCRRRTRGVETTIRLIEHLLNELKGEKGKDLLGVPLLDIVRIEHIWRVQKRHVKCIQDVPGVLLYTEMGTTTTKGGIVLTKYRCARGSTSLESFHLHLNRFIPGSSANTLNFQLYLLEGLNRWNQDRAAASVVTKPSSLLTYAGDVVHCLNTNSLKVIGRKYVPTFQPPAKYTGELIGVDYLLSQTGQPLQRVNPDAEETDQLLEDINVEELEDEGFEEDLSDDPTMTLFYEDLTTTGDRDAPRIETASSSTQPAAASSVSPAAASSVPPAAASSVPPAAAASVLTAAASSVPPAATASSIPPAAAASVLTAAVSSVPTAAASSVPPAAASSVLTAAVSSVPPAAAASSVPPAAAASVLTAAASSVPPAAAASVLTAAVSSVPTAAASSVPPAAASSVLTAAVSSVPPAAAASSVPPAAAASVLTAAVSSVPTAAASSVPPAAASSVLTAAVSSVLTAAVSSVPPAAASSVLTAAVSSVPPAAAASSVPPAAAASVLTAAVSSVPTAAASSVPPAAASSVLTASSTSDVSTGQPDVSAPDSPTQVSERDLAVDDKNLPGMDRVDSLADYLLQLRDKTGLTICNQQVNDIVALWHKLLDYDKEQVVFAARQQDTRLTTGRFKKKAVFTPGVDSLKHCVLGSTASPAQWPDCCRLVEAIFIRLCRIHRSPRRKGKSSSTRWTLILHDYGTIRQLLLNNGPIMQNTNLQLVEVNQATLVQWHNEKIRRQDLSVLLQGINLPAPLPVASEPLPPASVRPASLKRRITSMQPEKTAEVVRAKLPSQRLLLPMPQGIMGPVQVLTTGLSSSATCVSQSTPAFTVYVVPTPTANPFLTPQASSAPSPSATLHTRQPRAYNRRVEANTCKKCGQFRTTATGHSQYRGTIYCPNTETLNKEQWLDQIKKKK
ncbi:unnamed protein product [Leuciscus chuanchicus]